MTQSYHYKASREDLCPLALFCAQHIHYAMVGNMTYQMIDRHHDVPFRELSKDCRLAQTPTYSDDSSLYIPDGSSWDITKGLASSIVEDVKLYERSPEI